MSLLTTIISTFPLPLLVVSMCLMVGSIVGLEILRKYGQDVPLIGKYLEKLEEIESLLARGNIVACMISCICYILLILIAAYSSYRAKST